jgi:hypothetical protein
LAAVEQGLQLVPQLSTSLSERHSPEHSWYPESQRMVHDPAEHPAEPLLLGAAHGAQLVPQELMLVSLTHEPEQLWKPVSQLMPQVPPEQVGEPLAGSGQTVGQLPQ